MSVQLSCPSCNTSFALPALPDGRRAECPRCAEAFPIRTFTEGGDGCPAAAGGASPRVSRTKGEGRKMLGVFAAALVGVLLAGLPPFVVYWRTKGKAQPAPARGAASAPAGLGYLRPDTSAAFAVRPGPLLAYAERTRQQPRDVLAQTGLPDAARTAVEQFGVDLAQIDHVAGGITLGEGEDALHVTLALVLKQPLADEGAFLAKLRAKPVAGKLGRYEAAVGKVPLLLVRAVPTVWVFAYTEADLSEIDRPHGPSGSHFRTLRPVVSDVPAGSAVWLAANDDRDWTEKPIVKLLAQSAEVKKWVPVAKGGRGGFVAVSLGEQPLLSLRVRTTDDATGDRVRTYLTERAKEAAGAKAGGEGATASFEAPFDANTGKLLQRMLTDAGK
jgi:hypothetical protein